MKQTNQIIEIFDIGKEQGSLYMLNMSKPGYYVDKIDRKNNKAKVIFKKIIKGNKKL